MTGVLEGLRVLDLSWGIAGPMATMVLSDHGAAVTRIESPHGEPFPEPDGYRVWHRGKRSAELDLAADADRQVFLALATHADVVVTSFAPGVAERLGVAYDAVRALNPRLIYCAITGYGRDTLLADRPAYDALVAARTGLQWEARGWYGSPIDRILGRDAARVDVTPSDAIRIGADRDGPIFAATPTPSIATAYLATLGISAALRARERTGAGQLVETSLLQGVIAFSGCNWQRPSNPDAPGYQMGVLDRRQTWGLVRTKDGWVCMWATPHTWAIAAGNGDELHVPSADELAARGHGRRGLMTIENRLAIQEEAAPIFRKFPTDEWVSVAAASGDASIQPIRPPEDALRDPALLADGSVTEVDDPELGRLRQAGILYRLHARRAGVRGPAPRRGEHTGEVRAEAASLGPDGQAHAVMSTAGTLRGPLDGVRVVDFGLAVAGPWASQMLADLGATVIKVDPPAQGYWFGTHMAVGVNRSKRSVGLDMKQPNGLEVAYDLVRSADVVVFNMRPQAAARLGLDYESLRAINPGLVYCHTRGHEDGPRSLLPGNDQTGNALGGTEWEDGGCWNGGRPWFGVTSGGDLGNGFLAAIAITQALYDRERTGQGQKVDASIINAALFNNSRVVTTPDGRAFDRPKLDAEQLGFGARYRLYRCAGGTWLCVAAVTDAQWQALTAAAGADTETELERVFATNTAPRWQELLDRAGVPCEVSDPLFSRRVFDDPELVARNWVVGLDGNPLLGHIDMHGVAIDFSDTPTVPDAAPPLLGEHTREVLRELGYDDDRIDALIASGTLQVAAVPSVL
jgi:crotonobetainyl-CoA:carnitine CoA-transferase CaiB-like acyl-CoA transferase